ncbi:MAG: hypothetical protein ABEJ76_07290 [Halanaeroarchaeum sp.]
MTGRGARGQSQTIGVVLILGITVLSVGAIAALGGSAIDQTQQSIDVQSAQHALSQLDSEASLVALSRAERQSVQLGRGRQGTYTVFPDRGRIVIRHHNYSGNSDTVLYNATLGQVRYETGETVVAYQGGGVWKSRGGDGSAMVSTPEFHYRSATLTLPVIRVRGDGSVSGSATAELVDGDPGRQIYPNRSSSYPDIAREYVNPVENGTLEIVVKSEFYRAWGAYFESRTDGVVSVYDANETAHLRLVSTGIHGAFDMPLEEEPMELRGLGEGHPLENLTIRIFPDQPESQEFAGLSWSLVAQEGSQKFELTLRTTGTLDEGDSVPASVYYTNGTAEQGWHADDAFTVSVSDVDGDGEEEAYIDANLTGDSMLGYTDIGTNDLTEFQANDDFATQLTFDRHEDSVTWEPETFDTTDQTTIGNLTNHYIGLFGRSVDLTVKDGNGVGGGAAGNINEDVSSGYVEFDGSGKFVTYLHVSENNVTVSLE